jgi:Ger(x)C family germination protein
MIRRAPYVLRAAALLLVASVLTSCSDRIDLDKTVILQLVALDIDDDNRIRAHYSAPSFTQSDGGQDEEIIFSEKGSSLRQLRRVLASDSGGEILSGKIQVLLLTDRFLAERDIFEEMNVFYRDPINPSDAILVYTQSPLDKVLKTKRKLSSMISAFIHDQITSSHEQGLSVMTTLERYNYMRYNRGMTPFMSAITWRGDHLENAGTVLLSRNGKRRALLSVRQTSFLLLLQNDAGFPLNINMTHEGHTLSFDVVKAPVKIRTDYIDDIYRFTIDMPITVNLTEYTSDKPFSEAENDLMQAIREEIKGECEKLVKLFQEKRVDPVGFGMHARAYRYAEFKKAQDNWTDRFADAKIEIRPVIRFKQFGIVK